jgi:hypothetical protein
VREHYERLRRKRAEVEGEVRERERALRVCTEGEESKG